MIPQVAEVDIHRVGNFEEREMNLAGDARHLIFKMLRDDLYSDKIKSPLREYLKNATDEHWKLGLAHVPVELTFPTALSPEVSIRDFARGLTKDEVFNFFGNYGASDKRGSNLTVGQFGLGCKSGFAYTDSFTVTSFKDGRVYVFNVYIDETTIGKVALLSEGETDEPNGVRVTLPVLTQDIPKFVSKGLEVIRYFKTKPTLKGLTYEPTWDDRAPIITGDSWDYFGGNGTAVVLMGEIAYPVDLHAIEGLESWERRLLQSTLHMTVDIGEVEVTGSREALQFTPRTVAAIRKRLVEVKDSMVAETLKRFAECKTLWEAKMVYNETIQTGGGYSQIFRESGEKVLFGGEEITDNVIRFPQGSGHHILGYSKNRKKIDTYRNDKIQVSRSLVLYFDDTNKAVSNYKRRARTLIEDGEREIQILSTSDVAGLEALLGVPVSTFRSYNAVVPTVTGSARFGVGADKTKRAKHQTQVFRLDLDKLRGFYKGAASEVWTIENVDVNNTVALFVPIDRFHPQVKALGIDRADELKKLLTKLELVGRAVQLPIYGIKKGTSPGNLVPFEKWFVRKVARMKDALAEVSLANASKDLESLDVKYLKPENVPAGETRDFLTLWHQAREANRGNRIGQLRELFVTAKVDVPKRTDLQELSDKFKAKFPVLRYVRDWNLNEPEVLEYIQHMEERAAQAALSN